MATHKVNIFEVLGSINKKERSFFTELPEDEQKAIHPFVLLRWMSGVNSPLQIMMLNEFVNPYVFPLANHRKLLIDTLMVSSPGKFQRYTWKKGKKQKSSTTPICLEVVKQTFNYSSREAHRCLDLLDNDTILSCALDLGYQNDDVKKLKKELKTR